MLPKTTKIANFKSHLSSYLAQVRNGREVVIMDRKTPIARVIPIAAPKPKLEIRPPLKKGGLKSVKFHNLPTVDVDVVALLREERGDR